MARGCCSRPNDGCCGATFRCLFLLLNWLLAAAGLALMGYSIYVGDEIANPPTDGSTGEAACSGTPGPGNGLGDAEWEEQTKRYWFALVIAAIGIWAFITAVFGLGGGKCDNACCIGTHTVMLTLALLAEAAFGLVFYFEEGWKWNLPPDASGICEEFRDLVESHLKICMYVGLGVLVLEVLTLVLGCAFWSRASSRPRRTADVEEPLVQPESQATAGNPPAV
eukprot:evm.model.scf_2964.1 EVM.evm.TU.scf_2964.1   scf_2964:12854-13522(+)